MSGPRWWPALLGTPVSLRLGLALRHLPFTFVQSPKTQFLKGLRFSKVQASSSSLWPTFQGQNALRESAHLGWGS